jgi:hypothetical protein
VIGPSRTVFVEEAADGAALIKRIPENAIFQKIPQFIPKPDLQGKHETLLFRRTASFAAIPSFFTSIRSREYLFP